MVDRNEIDKLLQDFERQAIPRGRWHHREHLLVASYYLINFEFEAALEKIRSGIKKLNAANGVVQTPEGGYHESITTFLAYKISQKLQTFPRETLFQQKIEIIENEFRDFKKIVLESYSKDLINSWTARTQWVEPDLKPLR